MVTYKDRSGLSGRIRWHLVAVAAIVALAAGLRFYALAQESLWFDEAFSVSVAQWNPQHVIFDLTRLGLRTTDRNLFHLMLHYALGVSRSEVGVRFIPALSGVLSVVAIYAVGKRLFGLPIALLAALLLAISPVHVWYSREARGYALLTLLGLLAAYFALRALADNSMSSWLGYVVISAGAAYTHSFGLLLVAALDIFVVVWLASRQWPRAVLLPWLWAHVLLLAALLPFVRGFLGQSSAGWGTWIGDRYGVPTVKDLVTTIGTFSYGTAYDQQRLLRLAGLLIFAVPCAAALARLASAFRERRWRRVGEPILFMLIYLVVPIGTLFLASQVTPLYLVRYLLPFLPPYLLLVAFGLTAMPNRWLAVATLGAILVLTIPSLATVYGGGQKENWRDGAAYVASHAQPQDIIVFYDAYVNIPFNFYYNGAGHQLLISRFAPDAEMAAHVESLTSSRYPRLWLVLSHADGSRLTSLIEAVPTVRPLATREFLGLRVVSYQVGRAP